MSTILQCATESLRHYQDMAIRNTSGLIGYDDVTLYRYKIFETAYKDQEKQLLETINGISMFIDIPGDVTNTSSNVLYLEDILPIVALFPWKRTCELDRPGEDLLVDIWDEFEISLIDEFGNTKRKRFEIVDRHSAYQQFHLYREFICAPKREDLFDSVEKGTDGTIIDRNDAVSEETKTEIDSLYDAY